jgi:hypothetical protein
MWPGNGHHIKVKAVWFCKEENRFENVVQGLGNINIGILLHPQEKTHKKDAFYIDKESRKK